MTLDGGFKHVFLAEGHLKTPTNAQAIAGRMTRAALARPRDPMLLRQLFDELLMQVTADQAKHLIVDAVALRASHAPNLTTRGKLYKFARRYAASDIVCAAFEAHGLVLLAQSMHGLCPKPGRTLMIPQKEYDAWIHPVDRGYSAREGLVDQPLTVTV